VPILRSEASRGSIYVGITQHGWLEFLRSYPISERATLTLNDRQGLIIARTLNNERWVGRRSGAAFLESIRGQDEGTSQIRGLEGQHFYTAFSRSRVSGWVLGTGVPREEVEASLRDSTVRDARRRHRHRARGGAVRRLDRLARHRRDHQPLRSPRARSRRPAGAPARRCRSRRRRRCGSRSARPASCSPRATPSATPRMPARPRRAPRPSSRMPPRTSSWRCSATSCAIR
jgi:hypothetical protein